jgi:hypothetical protein
MVVPKSGQDNKEKTTDDGTSGGKERLPVEVHIDVRVNPFLKEDEKQAIIEGKLQDPEWD